MAFAAAPLPRPWARSVHLLLAPALLAQRRSLLRPCPLHRLHRLQPPTTACNHLQVLTFSLTLPAEEGRGKVVTSRASLVDLAGSERAKDAGDGALRRQESIAINQSLTTLGLVISTLAARDTRDAHVPYRNSKLTHLLKDSLGGTALAVMLCTVSPSPTQASLLLAPPPPSLPTRRAVRCVPLS